LLAAIVTSAADAVVSAGPDDSITSWTPAAEALYGITEEVAIGQPMAQLLAGFQTAPVLSPRAVRASPVVVEGSRFDVYDADGTMLGSATIAHDISARLAVEEQLALTRRELEAKNRWLERSNSDLEEFAYIASHDLSEPLRAISGMVSLLARRYEGQLDADADEFIGFAVDGCQRLRRMIDDLLAFSRAGRVDLTITDVALGDLVAASLRALAPQVTATGATVDVGELPILRADATQLAQVVQNLLSNAMKFHQPDQAPEVRVRAEREATQWRIEVSDDGIGIDEQYRERIFRMFQRLHPAEEFGGTGIGLAISKRIVERHGGHIGVTSNRSGGATFWIALPLQEGDLP
jgi:light-regulated signal transduction histidine kinase (bacteriophytochrome)